MRNLAALSITLFLTSCLTAPVTASMISKTGSPEACSSEAWPYTQLVKYKDARVSERDVIEVVAPNLELPKGWEQKVERLVKEIYQNDLTEEELFHRMYIDCIHGYTM